MEKQKNEKTARLTKLFIVTALVCALAALCVALTVTRGGSAETPVAAASVSAAELCETEHDKVFGAGSYADPNHDHSGATELTDAGGTLISGNYYLTSDLALFNNIAIEADANVNICLHGHTLTLYAYSPMFDLAANGTLKVFDGKDPTGGDGGSVTSNCARYASATDGNADFYGVTFSGGSGNQGTFGRMFTFYGASKAVFNDCKMTKINNIYGSASVLFCGAQGELTLNGCEITGNTASRIAGDDYGNACGKFIIKDTEISGNGSSDALALRETHVSGKVVAENLTTTSPIVIDAPLTAGTNIQLASVSNEGVYTSGFATHHPGADPADFFTVKDASSGYLTLNADGEVTFLPYHYHDQGQSSEILFDKFIQPTTNTITASGNYMPLRDTVVTDGLTISGQGTVVNLCLNKYALSSGSGAAITVEAGATLNLYGEGGNVQGITVAGTLNLISGSIANSAGAGVTCADGGTFTMTGGSITGNAGHGVVCANGSTFTMSGGSITNNTSGGVTCESGSTFTMTGGSITNNTSDTVGGLDMRGSADVTVTGGSITGNTTYGAATAAGVAGGFSGDIKVSGNVTINNNYREDKSTGDRVEMNADAGKYILTGALTGGKLGVSDKQLAASPFTEGFGTYHSGGTPSDYFEFDAGAAYRYFTLDSGEVAYGEYHVHNAGTDNEIVFNNFITSTTTTLSEGNYALTGDVVLDSGLVLSSDSDRTVNICLNGYRLSLKPGVTGSVIRMYFVDSATLNLYDDDWTDTTDATRKHSYTVSTAAATKGLYVFDDVFDANHEYIEGGVISGGTQAGVYNYAASSSFNSLFHMHGGTIAGNLGGGVYNASQFRMSGGSIEGNYNAGGYGVNNAQSHGGGVYVSQNINNSTIEFTMTGGVIRNNVGVGTGGVYFDCFDANVDYNFFRTSISGGQIYGNTLADDTRADIYVANGGKINITGALTAGSEKMYVDSATGGVFTNGLNANGLTVADLFACAATDKELATSLDGAEATLRNVNSWRTPYNRADWVYGSTPTTVTAPAAAFGDAADITIQYYTDAAYANEVTADYFTDKTNAGAYYVKATLAATDTYTALSGEYTFTIEQATINTHDVKWSYTLAYTYTGDAYTVSLQNVPTDITVTYTNATKTSAGAYTATAELNYDKVNYKLSDEFALTLAWEIKQATNEWTTDPTTENITYGESVTVTAAAKFGRAAYEYRAEGADAWTTLAPTDAGKYYVRVSVAESANYTALTSDEVAFEISPKEIAITIDNAASVYGDKDAPLTWKLRAGSTLAEWDALADIRITLTRDEGTNVGTYGITGTDDDNNYAITITGGTYEITPRSVSVKIDDKTSVYGSELQSYTYSVTSGTVISGDTLDIEITKTDGAAVGEYTLTGTDNDSNYDITIAPGTYTITPKAITVTVENKTSVYGDELVELTYTLADGALVGNDTLGVTLTKAAGNNAGEYAITGEWTNKNYAVTFTDGTYTITPKAITVTVENKTSVYGDELVDLTYTLEDGALVGNDTLGVTLTKAAGNNANEYTITGEWTNKNYAVDFIDGTYTITPRAVSVKINDATSVYGEEIKELTYEVTSGTVIEGDELNVTLTKAAGETVDEYAITGAYNNGNYTVTITPGTYTITKATYDMTGVAFEDLKVTYNGQAHAIEVTGLPAGVSVAYDKETSYTNAGEYVITATFTAADTENYNALSVTTMTATLTIDKAVYDMAGVRFSDATVTYNGAAQSIEATNLPTGVTVAYEGNGQTQAGTYTVKATFTGDANHEAIETMEVTLTIKKAVYDMSVIAFDSITVTYDGASHSLAIAGTLPAGVTVTYENNGKTEVGTYTVIAKFTGDAENYELIANKTATLTINAQAVEQEKGGCGDMVMDGVTIGGIALAALVVGAILLVRRKRSK